VATYIATWCSDLLCPGHMQWDGIKTTIEPMAETGRAAKVVAKILTAAAQSHGETAARALYESSGLNLKNLLHPEDRSDKEFVSFVSRSKLEFLTPFLGCQKYLAQALTSSEDLDAIVTWLKSNLATELLCSAAGARTIMRALLSHFSTKAQEANFKKYGKVPSLLYGEDTIEMRRLQLQMVYEVQVFCHECDFEKDLVKRLFYALYECDIVVEDTFTMWKEDTENSEPGKRAALLHANAFLQWLATAEEEDEEGSEDDA